MTSGSWGTNVVTNARRGSTIILPPNYLAAVAQSLAGTEPEDLGRLKTVLEEAQGTKASADQVAKRVEQEVPTASPLAQLLKDGGMPLAQWLSVLITALTLLMTIYQQQTGPRTITPQQVEEIISRVLNERESERTPGPKPTTETKAKTKAKAPDKRRTLRPRE